LRFSLDFAGEIEGKERENLRHRIPIKSQPWLEHPSSRATGYSSNKEDIIIISTRILFHFLMTTMFEKATLGNGSIRGNEIIFKYFYGHVKDPTL